MLPLLEVGQEEVGREAEILDYAAPSQLYVHQNETVSTYITVHNKAEQTKPSPFNRFRFPNLDHGWTAHD